MLALSIVLSSIIEASTVQSAPCVFCQTRGVHRGSQSAKLLYWKSFFLQERIIQDRSLTGLPTHVFVWQKTFSWSLPFPTYCMHAYNIQLVLQELTRCWTAQCTTHNTCAFEECRVDPHILRPFKTFKPICCSSAASPPTKFPRLTTIDHSEKLETSEFASSALASLVEEKSHMTVWLGKLTSACSEKSFCIMHKSI